MIKLKKVLSEKFYDIVKSVGKDKGDWIDLEHPDTKNKLKSDIPAKENIFNLVNFAYDKALGEPHVGVQSPHYVGSSGKYDFWEAIDINDNPDAEAVLFGKRLHGIKISGIGHDGEKLSKFELVKHMSELFRKPGYWAEVSSPASDALLKRGTPIVTDKEEIQKLFPNSKFTQWFDDGSYTRIINNKLRKSSTREYIFGHPKI